MLLKLGTALHYQQLFIQTMSNNALVINSDNVIGMEFTVPGQRVNPVLSIHNKTTGKTVAVSFSQAHFETCNVMAHFISDEVTAKHWFMSVMPRDHKDVRIEQYVTDEETANTVPKEFHGYWTIRRAVKDVMEFLLS